MQNLAMTRPCRANLCVSIVAVSGLGSHAFGSFKERGGDHMWLRDALPRRLVGKKGRRPMARVMIFGYSSRVADSTSMQNIDDLGKKLRNRILDLASTNSKRPVLVIAHSLGGLIFKEVD